MSDSRLMFAVEDCTRCGGSGHYSSCARFGTTCFKCSGSGVQYTAEAGKARDAVAAWRAARASIAVEDVTAGMLVRVKAGAPLRTVTEVRERSGVCTVAPDGTRTHLRGLVMAGVIHTAVAGSTVQRQLTPAERVELDAFTEALPGVFRAGVAV